jgi:RimJ/RimL family protein N-acetyltransferase
MATPANPILLNIPHELSSDRLMLRAPADGDGAIVCPSVRESLAELKTWMPWATEDYNEQSAEEWCRKAATDFLSRHQLQYLIFLRQEGRHIGNIGAFEFNWKVPNCEVGYWLNTADTSHGYMTESVGVLLAMLRYRLNVRRVQICTDAENLRSRRVAELAGFQLEGILRNHCIATGGKLRNSCIFSWIDPA